MTTSKIVYAVDRRNSNAFNASNEVFESDQVAVEAL